MLAGIALMLMAILNPMQAQAKETYISDDYALICTELGEQYDICPQILIAIIEKESSGKADAVSADGKCIGLCQINKKLWGKDNDLTDPGTNIRIACDIITDLREQYTDMAAVLMAYHGERNVSEKSRQGRLSKYALWILNRAAELEEEDGNSE